jgi:RNA recognition motif-containing protein
MASLDVHHKNTFLHVLDNPTRDMRKTISTPPQGNMVDLIKDEKLPRDSIGSVSTAYDLSELRNHFSPKDSMSEIQEIDEERLDDPRPIEYKLPELDTTVMIRHIPCKYTQEGLMEEILVYSHNFDYFYLPNARSHKVEKNLGYAFINFRSHDEATIFINNFGGYHFKLFPNSTKRAEVCFAEMQGRDKNLASFRASKAAKSKYKPWVAEC